MKKIIVLGANGYIARNLTKLLYSEYRDYDISLYGIEEKSIDGYSNYTKVDMCSMDDIKKIDFNCDIIYMFVGRTGSSIGFNEYNSFIDINQRTLLNLLTEYVSQKSKARIVYPSTRLVYKGKTDGLKETDAKEFRTIYALNKFCCEQYLIQYHEVFGVQYTVFRICVPYGTLVTQASSYGTAEFMLSKAKKGENITLYGDGSSRRSLIYMGDLCKILIEGAISKKCGNDVFNIGGENYSLREMAELISRKYNICVDYVPWPDIEKKIESGDTVFDSQKLDKVIGSYIRESFEHWVKYRLY